MCVSIFTATIPTRQFCPRGQKTLNSSDGFIVFYPALSRTSCSLGVKVKPGEQVKVTVFDFSKHGQRGPLACSLQMGFQEQGGPVRYLDGCKLIGARREALLYQSRDSHLNISVLPRINTEDVVLLRYQGDLLSYYSNLACIWVEG